MSFQIRQVLIFAINVGSNLPWVKPSSQVRDSGFLKSSGGFIVWFWQTNLGSEGFKVQFFQIWAQVCPVSGQTGSKFGFFGEFRMGLKLSFGRRTWVRVSSKFYLSSSKQFEVPAFGKGFKWVRNSIFVHKSGFK